MSKPGKRKQPPADYFVAYGGATEEGDFKGGEGWFFGPSEQYTVFHKTRQQAVDASWAEYFRKNTLGGLHLSDPNSFKGPK